MTVERFWDFSVRTYRTQGVPEACLSLQDDYGADVNMLLYCAWIALAAGRFDDGLFRRAGEFSDAWAEHVVKPLRSARTWMKQSGCRSDPVPAAPCMALREDIKSVEFAAEKMQQEVLESLLITGANSGSAPDRIIESAIVNLHRYLVQQDIPVSNDVCDKLCVILRAAFPDMREKITAGAFAAES